MVFYWEYANYFADTCVATAETILFKCLLQHLLLGVVYREILTVYANL